MPVTRNCDDCENRVVEEGIWAGGQWKTCVLSCSAGHKPRFYKPRGANDFHWGWKRACADFVPSNAKVSGAGTASAGPPG